MSKAKELAKKALQKNPMKPKAVKKGDEELIDGLDDKPISSGTWDYRSAAVGDTILGDVLALELREGRYDDAQLYVTLGTADGTRSFFCNGYLKREFAANGVNIGDRVAVQYRGRQKLGKKGKPGHVFAMNRAGGPATAVDYDQMLDVTPARKQKKGGKKKSR
jgi:hypothetical protein